MEIQWTISLTGNEFTCRFVICIGDFVLSQFVVMFWFKLFFFRKTSENLIKWNSSMNTCVCMWHEFVYNGIMWAWFTTKDINRKGCSIEILSFIIPICEYFLRFVYIDKFQFGLVDFILTNAIGPHTCIQQPLFSTSFLFNQKSIQLNIRKSLIRNTAVNHATTLQYTGGGRSRLGRYHVFLYTNLFVCAYVSLCIHVHHVILTIQRW